MKINSRKELYEYLKTAPSKNIGLGSTYFLIKYNNHIEPIYFFHYEDSYFECPCEVHEYDISESKVEEYVRELYKPEVFDEALEFEKTMQRGNKHYEIDCPQVTPFLPDEIEILDVLSETECLDWMIENVKE